MEAKNSHVKSRKRRYSSGNDAHSACSESPSAKKKTFFGRVVETIKDVATPSWLGNFLRQNASSTGNTQFLPKNASGTNKPGHQNHNYSSTGDSNATASSSPAAVNGHEVETSLSYGMATRRNIGQSAMASGQHDNHTTDMPHTSTPYIGSERTVAPATAAPVAHSFNSQQTSVSGGARQSQYAVQRSKPSHDTFQFMGTPKDHLNSPYSTPARLWQTPSSAYNESTATKKASSFNISSFAKSFNDSMDTSRANSSTLGNSSFYKGKTVYGGSSSKRTFSMPAPTPYKRVTRHAKAADDSVKTAMHSASKTAKAIMAVIGKTGTHADPRDVAQNFPQLFNPAVYLRRKDASTERKVLTQPPLDKMVKTSQARITPNRQRLDAKQLVTSASHPTSQSHVHVSAIENKAPGSFGGGGKMRNRRSQAHYRTNQTMDSVKTPRTGSIVGAGVSFTNSSNQYDFRPPMFVGSTARPQPVSPNLGQFSFASPSETSKDRSEKRNASNAAIDASDEDSDVEAGSSTHIGYSADCLMNAKPLSGSTVIAKPFNNGKNALPLGGKKVVEEKEGTDGWKGVFDAPADKWSCTVCLIQNDKDKEKCVACGSVKPAKVCGDSKPAPAPAANWGDLFQKPAGQWSCSVCLVTNPTDKTSCAACGTSKPADKPAAASKPADVSQQSKPACTTSGWGDLFSKQAAQWSCGVCLVTNPADKTSCPACGTSKPADKTAAATVEEKAGTDGWKGVFDAPTDKWSCTVCLIQNDKDKEKCVACGGVKPAKVSGDSKPAPAANWGDLFQKPAGQWNCDACLVANPADKTTCVACGSNNPDKPATNISLQPNPVIPTSSEGSTPSRPGFWTCDMCHATSTMNHSICTCCAAYKPGFQSSLGDLDKGGHTLPIYSDKQPSEQQAISSANKPTNAKDKPLAAGFPSFSFLKSKSVSTADNAVSQSGTKAVASGIPVPSFVKSQQAPATSVTGSESNENSKPITGGFPVFTFNKGQPADQGAGSSAKISTSSSMKLLASQGEKTTSSVSAPATTTPSVMSVLGAKSADKSADKAALFQGFGSSSVADKSSVFSIASSKSSDGQDDAQAKKPLFSFGMQSKTSTTESSSAPLFGAGSDNKQSHFSTGFGNPDGIFNKPSTSTAAPKIPEFSLGTSQKSKSESTKPSPGAPFAGAQSTPGFTVQTSTIFGGTKSIFGGAQASALGGGQAAPTAKEPGFSMTFGGTQPSSTNNAGSPATFGGQQLFPQPGSSSSNPSGAAPVGSLFGATTGLSSTNKRDGTTVFGSGEMQAGGKKQSLFQFGGSTHTPVFGSSNVAPVFGNTANVASAVAPGNEPATFGSTTAAVVPGSTGASVAPSSSNGSVSSNPIDGSGQRIIKKATRRLKK